MAFVEPIDLNPTGKVSYPDLVEALVARYKFQKFPEKADDFDETKGVVFTEGKSGNTVIERLTIYAYGILVDTRVSTSESKRLLEEALDWGTKDLGLAYKPVTRWQFASQVTFHSKVPLAAANSALQLLTQGVARGISDTIGEKLDYDVTVIVVDHDQLARKHALGRFSIQRRENTPFSENKYFSEAPLPTETHISLLEQFEANISRH
jgi:hypothetical protein